MAQSRAQGQLENIPEPFNNPWPVFKLTTKAQIRESLQIFRSCKKTSVHVVCKFPSFIFMLGESHSLQTLLLPQRAQLLPTERTCLRAVKEDVSGSYLENRWISLLLFGCLPPCLKCPQVPHYIGRAVSLWDLLQAGIPHCIHPTALQHAGILSKHEN